jgi:cobalamin synthase
MSDMMQSTTTKKSIVRGCVLLSVVGAFIGMLAGMFVWIQSSTQYKAVATNQILNPGVPDLPLQDSGGDHYVSVRRIPTQGSLDGPRMERYLACGGIIGVCLFAIASILLYRSS